MKSDGCCKHLHKIVQFVAIAPLFWVYTLHNFLAILVLWQRKCCVTGKCEIDMGKLCNSLPQESLRLDARKRQLQIICANMIETEHVIREH